MLSDGRAAPPKVTQAAAERVGRSTEFAERSAAALEAWAYGWLQAAHGAPRYVFLSVSGWRSSLVVLRDP